MRRIVMCAAAAAAITLLASPVSLPAAAAPAEPSPSGSADAAPGPVDRNGDRIGDDLAARLGRLGAEDRVNVIVRGLGPAAGRGAVGGFALRHDLPIIDGFSARMTVGQARALAHVPGVERVDAVRTVRITDTATDADFGAATARAGGLTGAGIGVCIVDTGVDPGHEQIAPRPVTFVDYVNGRTTAYDDHGHGTHVASIALGDGVGGPAAADHVGVAPGASLYAAKVLDSSGSGSNDDVAAGIQWCADQPGVRVLSMSLGDASLTDGSDPMSAAVNAVVDGGLVAVVAAGNSGDGASTINSPGAAQKALTVGAGSDWSGPAGTDYRSPGVALAYFSSRGPVVAANGTVKWVKPDITAPGVTVSAARAGTTDGYVTYSGTSMATPYVAGAVALGLSAAPGATPAQVKAAMQASAEDRGRVGTDNDWGAGLLDVPAFVSLLQGTSSTGVAFPTDLAIAGSVTNGGSQTYAIPNVTTDAPLAVTLLIDGASQCDLYWPGYGCLMPGEWAPDLDVELRDPSGTVIASSTCALGDACGVGHQETIGVWPTIAGDYSLRVYSYSGGGTFVADVSHGPVAGSSGPPPPPPANQPPSAVAGPDQTKIVTGKKSSGTFSLDGSASSDPDGDALTYHWVVTNSAGTTMQSSDLASWKVTLPLGSYTATLTVTDTHGAADDDSATLTVRRR